MADKVTQNFTNHARYVPMYHFVLFGILMVNLGWSLYRVARHVAFESLLGLLLAVGLLILFFYARLFATTLQDRVIRLEMRLRLERLLPADLKARIGEFAVDQLIALRFAGDEELADLARRVLNEKLSSRTEIKKLVTNWQADHLRV